MIGTASNPAEKSPHRLRAIWRVGALCAGVLALAGCKRMDEGQMRSILSGWVPLGDTVFFQATGACAVGVFQIADPRIAAPMPVAGSAREAATILNSQGQVAIVAPRLTPDVALLHLIAIQGEAGTKMRMAGLEGRACMDLAAETTFASALINPSAVLLMDRDTGLMALLDTEDGLLIATMGSE
ncbi:MAG: hypothetical protein Q4P24_00700 [Rhodobacterales bacterium]|nr:hypothetical protein [Rhodobacterales bacterium]